MSIESIVEMLEAQGTFPEEKVVCANFETLFAYSVRQKESPADVAKGFLLALDQHAHVSAVMDDKLGQQLYQWVVGQWATEPMEFCKRLCAILVNVGTPEALAFMQTQHAQATDKNICSVLEDAIEELSEIVAD